MRFLKIAVIGLVTGSTIWATASTYRKSGIRTVTHPRGLSLREESISPSGHAGVIMPRKRVRSHRGGGLRSGK